MVDRSLLRVLGASLVLCALTRTVGFAQQPEANNEADLAMKLQNPVAALISVPFQSNFEWGGGPQSEGFKYTLNFQPVIPITLTQDYNLISRTIVPVIYQDDVVPHGDQSGLGDILQSFFFSPKAPGLGGIIWGVGPVFLLPTSTEDFLGNQKFGSGPTLVALKQASGWTVGMLSNHVISTGGTRSTSHVNSTFLQPFLSFTTKMHTSFTVNTESTYDWENSKWTVPLNLTVAQLFKLGGQPMQLQLGPKLYTTGPTAAPDWGIRFAYTLLFPTS